MKTPPRKPNTAFTLIELLVSIAVLAILTLFISQLFSSATTTATMSRAHLDCDEAARLVFDRMENDFASMVKRADVNYIFCKNGAAGSTGSNDAVFFYSEAPGYLNPSVTATNASTVALVGYRINSNNYFYPNTPVMERLGENLTWGGAPDLTGTNPGGPVFLPNPVSALFTMTGAWAPTLAGNWTHTLGTPPYNSLNDTSHFQVLSEMVLRMEFCFLLKGGTYALSGTSVVTGTTGYSNVPTAIPALAAPYVTSNYFTGSSAPDLAGNVYGFPPDLAGIVVTIAVLDNTTRKVISNGGVAALAAALGDSISGNTTFGNVQANPQLTAQLWQGQLQQSGLAQSLRIPQKALQQVRVYERTFYLDAK